MTAGKTIALTLQTFVGKVIPLLFNKLSRFVITFLLRSKWLLISWLQPPSAVILVLKKIKSVTGSSVSPSICHEVMGPDAPIFMSTNIAQGFPFLHILAKNLLSFDYSYSDRREVVSPCGYLLIFWGAEQLVCRILVP